MKVREVAFIRSPEGGTSIRRLMDHMWVGPCVGNTFNFLQCYRHPSLTKLGRMINLAILGILTKKFFLKLIN